MEDAHIIGLYWARDEEAIPASGDLGRKAGR